MLIWSSLIKYENRKPCIQRLRQSVDLRLISLKIPKSELHIVKPSQVIVKTESGASCLIFSKGVIRLIGAANVESTKDARQIIDKEVLHWWTHEECPELVIQTMTITQNLPQPINFKKFQKLKKKQYEFELFSDLMLTKYPSQNLSKFFFQR